MFIMSRLVNAHEKRLAEKNLVFSFRGTVVHVSAIVTLVNFNLLVTLGENMRGSLKSYGFIL